VEYKIEEVVEIEVGHKIEEVVKIVVNCKIEEEVIWALGWDFGVDFGSVFGSVFGVHFCTLFGQFFARDLLVLRDFFDVDGGFWPVFRRVLDRTFAPVFTFRGMA
jgi:hypothetical protein